MPPARLIAIGAIHVDTPDEAPALDAVARLAAETGFELGRLRWTAYPKLGPQSRVGFYWLLPEGVQDSEQEETAVMAALDGFCIAVAGAGAAEAAHRLFHRHDEITPGAAGFHDERIMDARQTPFLRTEFVWFDVEINTYPAAQKDLRRWVREG